MPEKERQNEIKISKITESTLLNKILELQASSLDSREQISTLINFARTLLNIDTIAIYANFAGQQINLISSGSTAKPHTLLGYVLEKIADRIDVNDIKYPNTLIPLSELDILKPDMEKLSDAELNTLLYPILSPNAKQIYGIILVTNSKTIFQSEQKRLLIFLLNYLTKTIEESDLGEQVRTKDFRLKLLSRLSNSLRGVLKPEKAVEIVLKEVRSFLKLEDIYFARWLSQEKKLEVINEIVTNENRSLKGFIHRANAKNPIIRLLYKNQYMTFKNKNLKKVWKVFVGQKEPAVFAVIPVLIRTELLGALICVSTLPNSSTTTEDLRITQDIAGQLAVILNQANLYEESLSTAQREFLLNSITTMIRDTLEVSGVLEKTAREVGQVFGVNACGAFIIKEGDIGFQERSIWATSEDYKNKLSLLPLDKEDSPLLPDPIAQSIVLPNLQDHSFGKYNELINHTGCKSFLACSLNRGNKTIGILSLAHFETQRYWTSSEVQLLEAITDQVEMALSQAELYDHVQRTERQMNLLHQVSAAIRDSLEISTVMARTAQDLGEILGASRCFIRRLRSVNPLVVLATEQEYLNKEQDVGKAADLILGFEEEWLHSLVNLPEVDRANSFLHIVDVPEKYKDASDPLQTILKTIQIKSFLGIPLVAAGNIIGSLCVHQCDRYRKFTESEIEFVRRVASEASVAVLNADLFTKVQYQAQRDGLTDLYNHAYFQTALHHEVERTKRTNSDLSVIMLDLDYLKKFNDTYGHKAGDEAIVLVAGKMKQCLRQMDIIARIGGDEFAALLPETRLDDAEKIAKRILDTLNKTVHSCGLTLSASIGVSGTPHEERNKEKILKAADDTAYVSKREGRNRVTSSKILDEIGPVEKKPVER